MGAFFQMEAFDELPNCATFAAKSLQIFAEVSPPVAPGTVARLAIWNLPTIGPKLSTHLKAMKAEIERDLNENPALAGHCLTLPNCPKYGVGDVSAFAMQAHVQEFRDLVTSSMKEIKDAFVVQCSALYNEETMYSPARDLRVEFLLVLANRISAAGGQPALQSLWAKSFLFKRRSLPKLVDAMPRHSFKDWSTKSALFDRPNLCVNAEMKQWHSGVNLHSALLQAACKGVGFTKDSRILVKDMHLYDDTLAMACANLNCSKDRGLPLFGYVGVGWGHPEKARNRKLNVDEAVLEQLIVRAKEDPSSIPHFRMAAVGPAPMYNASQKPTYTDEQFKVTCPRANGELPIRQIMYDKWSEASLLTHSSDPVKQGLSWGDIVTAHNQEFNPTGVPHKPKRLAETAVADLDTANPDPLTLPLPGASEPQDEVGYKAANAVKVDSGNALADFFVTSKGGLVLQGKEDGLLSHTDVLFVLRGDAKQGPAAAKLMKDAENWVAYKLTPESLVAVTFTTPIKKEFPSEPIRLKDCLRLLEDAGHVKVQLYLHTVSRDSGTPSTYTVSQSEAEQAALEIKIQENLQEASDLSWSKISNYIDVVALKKCPHLQIVDRLQFNPALNKLSSGYPAVYPIQPIKIEKGKIGKLF